MTLPQESVEVVNGQTNENKAEIKEEESIALTYMVDTIPSELPDSEPESGEVNIEEDKKEKEGEKALTDAEYTSKVLEALNNDLSNAQDESTNAKQERNKRCWSCDDDVKYRCPRCMAASCSMDCVKRHKESTGCTGKRDRTAFVRLSEFTDEQLQSDFTFLEEANRIGDNAKRSMLNKRDGHNYSKRTQVLLKAAKERGMQLKLMPPGLQRRKENQSFYDVRKDQFLWSVDWRFSENGHMIKDKMVSETSTIKEALSKHITGGFGENAVLKAQLRSYFDTPLDELCVYIKAEGIRGSPRYHSIGLTSTLREVLQPIAFVEFPVFIVALPTEKDKYKGIDQLETSSEE
eukprot:Ihof_evm1s786 gene=Ihof_evmTU1s786